MDALIRSVFSVDLEKLMNRLGKISQIVFLYLSIGMVAAACAGKDKPSPADVQTEAFNNLRAEVEAIVSDQDRSDQAVEIINELESVFHDMAVHLVERSTRAAALNADYDTSREDIEEAYAVIQEDVVSNQRRVSEIHRQLVIVTTPEEWVELSKSRDAAMDAAIQSIQIGSGG